MLAPPRWRTAIWACAGACAFSTHVEAQHPVGQMSLDSLLSIPISAASRYEQSTWEAAASITVITGEDIEDLGYQTLADVLEAVRGFYVTYDRSYTYLGTRGFGRPSDNNNRVLVLVDGRRWNDVLSEAASIGLDMGLPLEAVERVEVVRGPGSTLYGSSAMLAVINVVTRQPSGREGVEAYATVGDHGMRRRAATVTALLPGDVSVSGSLQWAQDHGPDLYFPEFDLGENDGWARDVARNRAQSVWATVSWRDVTLGMSVFDGTVVYATAPYGSQFNSQDTYRDQRRAEALLEYVMERSSRLRVESEVAIQTEGIDGHLAFADGLEARNYDFDGNRLSGSMEITYDASEANRLVAGVEAQRIDPSAIWSSEGDQGDPLAIHPLGQTATVLSVYAQDEWQIRPDLSLLVGARVDHYSTTGTAVSPRGAVVFHPNPESTLKVLRGSAFRAPTPLERFLTDPADVPGVALPGPERIWTTEVVWEQRVTSAVHFALSAYEYRMKDVLVQRLEPRSEAGFIYENAHTVHGRGVSGEVSGRLGGRASFFANGSLQRSESARGRGEEIKTAVVNSPEYLLRVGGIIRLPGGITWGASLLRDAARETMKVGSTPPATHVDLNLRLPAMGPLVPSIALDNALDQDRRHPAGLELRQISIPQDGRRVRVSLAARF